jgi:hypothetical protein
MTRDENILLKSERQRSVKASSDRSSLPIDETLVDDRFNREERSPHNVQVNLMETLR